ncbi:MAG: hypothetical protein ACRDF5_11665, partial [bacterium]
GDGAEGGMNERLWEIYEQLCLVEMRGLDEFVRRVKGAEFGDFSRDDVTTFLRGIEANMLDNIQTKAMEHHVYAEMADEVSEETQKMFDELIEEFERA